MSPFIRPILFQHSEVCYLENAKCGSSSIIEALGADAILDSRTSRSEARLQVVRSRHAIDARNLPLWVRRRLVAPSCSRFRISFVRHPYTRLLSAYLDLICNPRHFPLHRLELFGHRDHVSFSEFVDLVVQQDTREMNFHWRPQVDLLDPVNIAFSFIGRMENFQRDLDSVIRELSGRPITPRGQEHRTGADELVARFYSRDIARQVAERYAEDFDYFGYSRDLCCQLESDAEVLPIWNTNTVCEPRRSWADILAIMTARLMNSFQRTVLWRFAWSVRRGVARFRGIRKG